MESVYVIQPVFDGRAEHLCREAVALIESAGACCVGAMFVKIREIDPYAYLGEGKIAELRERLHDTDATVLFNGELSPSQTSNLAAALEGKKVIDRVALILDIFAQRAVSSEGKLQVELAQLKYLYPRLKGKGAEVILYEPTLKEESFFGSRVLRDFETFAERSDVIVANRFASELEPFREKVYTRDLYHRD